MKCQHCGGDFIEPEIQLSHDVPCYLFCFEAVARKDRKNLADKWGRHNLCEECHMNYDLALNDQLKKWSKAFAKSYFEVTDGDNS